MIGRKVEEGLFVLFGKIHCAIRVSNGCDLDINLQEKEIVSFAARSHARTRITTESTAAPFKQMADFVQNLWQSVFVPGPTPTLLVATNAAFAALQVLLLTLALATYSVHFIILSCLSAGLWWSINWFSRELRLAQLKEEEERKEKKRLRGRRRGGKGLSGNGVEDDMDAGDDMMSGSDTGTETETETETGSGVAVGRMRGGEVPGAQKGIRPRDTVRDYGSHGTGYLSSGGNVSVQVSLDDEKGSSRASAAPVGSSSGLASSGQNAGTGPQMRLRPEQTDASFKRWSSSEGGELSTDSEWEKVDEGR